MQWRVVDCSKIASFQERTNDTQAAALKQATKNTKTHLGEHSMQHDLFLIKKKTNKYEFCQMYHQTTWNLANAVLFLSPEIKLNIARSQDHVY